MLHSLWVLKEHKRSYLVLDANFYIELDKNKLFDSIKGENLLILIILISLLYYLEQLKIF